MGHQDNLKIFQKATKNLNKAKESYHQTRIRLQTECPHNHIVEGAYAQSSDHSTRGSPPFRVCTSCGYAEEGWGCGYSFLNDSSREIKEISREKARKYVIGRIINNKDHSEVRFGRKRLSSILKQS